MVNIQRHQLIKYIKENNSSYSEKDFSEYSDEKLVLLKLKIELELTQNGKNGKPKNQNGKRT